ncbi:MAG: L-threonylcarbamoyladenylate synthase, partial [Candidatus Paceibacterota bacterium]
MNSEKIKDIAKRLKRGEIGVIPSDTLVYGLTGQALNRSTIENIYKLKGRRPDKPFIIVISKLSDLVRFGVKIDKAISPFLKKFWPGPVSIILSITERTYQKKLAYLHRQTRTLAFRLPKNKFWQELIKKTGPLVSTSANPEKLPPAQTISEAREYFGEKIKLYFSAGRRLN